MTTDGGCHRGLRWRLLAVGAAAAVAASSFSWTATRARAAPDEAAGVTAMQQALATHQAANRAATRRILELTPPTGPTHTTPSEAVKALLAGHEAVPEDQHQALAALDQLPSDQAVALARVIDAFAGFQDAATAAFASAKPGARTASAAHLEAIALG